MPIVLDADDVFLAQLGELAADRFDGRSKADMSTLSGSIWVAIR